MKKRPLYTGPRIRCAVCGWHFPAPTELEEPPTICGAPRCRAATYWTPKQWAGRARMADVHSVTGGQLSDWDIEALRRREGLS
jgi:hypothetical protein